MLKEEEGVLDAKALDWTKNYRVQTESFLFIMLG